MKKKNLIFVMLAFAIGVNAQTLDECQRAAEQNYPLIRQYDLIATITAMTVKNIAKGWLPQIAASAQATYQSDVAAWPESMYGMFEQMGLDVKGLKKDQYRVGLDLQQTIFDGGAISSQKYIAREQGNVRSAQNEVNMYNVRKRVNDMYFALLLFDEQITLNDDVQELLMSSERQLTSMVKMGTVATSDLDNVKAERLNAMQQNESMKSQRNTLRQMLSIFCGIEMNSPVKPNAVEVNYVQNRPELRLFNAQKRLADAQEKALNSQLMPKLGLFAQGYYGYPGLNMFDDMMRHEWSLNGIAGIKLSWNIGALYTRSADKTKLRMQRDMADNAREVFLFNNDMEQMQQNADIIRYREMMKRDDEIITLRGNVRKAAESKLGHGIIDVTGLIREINNENAAKVQKAIHEIDMLREIYNLKFSVNE
ncbi:MAG: TolC family protein [Prevotella sp.]